MNKILYDMEKRPFIYRIEDELGKGCYRFMDEIEWLNEHCKFNGRPCPIEDKGIDRYMDANEICGFKDMEQLKAWFTEEEIRDLAQKGFEIKKVYVKTITAIGEKQVLAIPLYKEEHLFIPVKSAEEISYGIAFELPED